jgi:Domain of unknown function DUF11
MALARAMVGLAAVVASGAGLALPGVAGAATVDFAVTLDGPKQSSVGGVATYEMEITNAGPDREPVKLRFTKGRGATSVDEGTAIRTVSQQASEGDCGLDTLGVICRPGAISPGDKVRVTVEMKVFAEDLPKLAVQATVAPEIEPAVDPNKANDHAEISTKVREPITLDGLPESCAKAPFTLKVSTIVPNAKRTKVIVDGKVIETSTKSKLTAKVEPKELDKGSHKLNIVVQGGSGPPLATLKRKFKTC